MLSAVSADILVAIALHRILVALGPNLGLNSCQLL